jgi:hypothetical protein
MERDKRREKGWLFIFHSKFFLDDFAQCGQRETLPKNHFNEEARTRVSPACQRFVKPRRFKPISDLVGFAACIRSLKHSLLR